MANKSRTTPPTAAQKRLAAERAAAARERIRAHQRRQRLVVVATAIGVVVVLAAVLVGVRLASGGKKAHSGAKATVADATVSQAVASVPASAFNSVGLGTASAVPKASSGAAMTADGKPRVLFVGAEFCPYCAAERWAIATSLARFGTFSNLGEVRSSADDVYASSPTLSFYGASYSSKYIVLKTYELQSNQVGSNGQYTSLQPISGSDQALFTKAGGGYPYLNLGGKYIETSAQYDPTVLGGKNGTQDSVAKALSDPSSAIAKGVLGASNLISAAVCSLTHGQPAAVCSSSGVQTATAALTGK